MTLLRWDPALLADRADPPQPQVLRFLIAEFRPLRGVIALSLCLTLVATAVEIWLIGYAGRLVDLLAGTPHDVLWQRHGAELLLVALVVVVLRPLAPLARETVDDVIFRPSAVTLVRWRAYRHVLRQSVGWFRRDLSGRIAAQVVDIGSSAAGAVYSVTHGVANIVFYILGAAWLLGATDLRLVLPLILWLGVYLGLMLWAVPRFRAASERFQAQRAALTGAVVDSFGNIDTVKLFTDPEAGTIDDYERFEATRTTFVALQRVEVAINIGMLALGGVLMAALTGTALVLFQSGAAPLGLVAAAVTLSFRITSMAEWLLDTVSYLFGQLGSLAQSLSVVARPLEVTDRPGAGPLHVTEGTIAFDRVTHHYGKGDGGPQDLTLTIAGGEKVGLVGRSGVGKSTVVNLLLRFFDPESGTIRIDGQDIAGVTQSSLRARIGMVTQEAALLHRSIRDNIGFGRPDATDDRIEAAARAAGAHDFILGLRDSEGRTGYDAHAGERGVTLSGGERQRIALARVFLKDAPIMILDEATSALDSEVEAGVLAALHRAMEGRTVIAIAHRLSTLTRMDRIVVMDAGRIVEQGPHAELLARDGFYARFWRHQSGGFIGTGSEAAE